MLQSTTCTTCDAGKPLMGDDAGSFIPIPAPITSESARLKQSSRMPE